MPACIVARAVSRPQRTGGVGEFCAIDGGVRIEWLPSVALQLRNRKAESLIPTVSLLKCFPSSFVRGKLEGQLSIAILSQAVCLKGYLLSI